MNNKFLKGRPQLRMMIRYAEIIVVVVLLVFAVRTYRELKMLRAAPVILPSYWFNVATSADQANRVQARGTWVTKQESPEFLHTTTIECVKSRMQCMESSAVVSVSEGGFMESVQTVFDVESWTDNEIVTKRDVRPCASRILTFDIAQKQAQSVVTPDAANKSCKSALKGEQIFKLVTGSAVRAATTDSAK